MSVRLVHCWRGAVRRLRLVLENPGEAWVRLDDRTAVTRYRIRNAVSRRPVTGDGSCVVSMTTYGARSKVCFVALESIARSAVRPRELILWVDETEIFENLPGTLKRLMRRGLQVKQCEDFGPHKKQFPYSATKEAHDLALATADDDVVYPRGWLAGLLAARVDHPDVINAYRARQMQIERGRPRPYAEWALKRDTAASLAIMATGTSGVIYPPALLDALRVAGTEFLRAAPQADDVWVHAVAASHGIMTRQIAQQPFRPRPIRGTVIHGTNEGSLTAVNVDGGQNDVQIARCYDRGLISRITAPVNDGPQR